ncbi:hypothetical protein ACFV9C_41850 [Kribbella sp. NPDC059898]|uniref:hypothetical protein n=1 Tax=Kribbella sp. NPDC059898 TaxID=3346995 RepID=UPI0036484FA7
MEHVKTVGLGDKGGEIGSALHALAPRNNVDVVHERSGQSAAKLRSCAGVGNWDRSDDVEGFGLVDLTAREMVQVLKEGAQVCALCEALRLCNADDVVNQPLRGTSRYENAIALGWAAAARMLGSD